MPLEDDTKITSYYYPFRLFLEYLLSAVGLPLFLLFLFFGLLAFI